MNVDRDILRSRHDLRSEQPNVNRSSVPSPEEEVATLNAENPWPGLLAFGEADQDYFEGRRFETNELLRLVLRERLTVLFGLSGLGKSSLLQAGLFPLLRGQNILPVYVRLDFSVPEPDFVSQVTSAIATQAELSKIEHPIHSDGQTLWEYFHRRGNDFWNPRNRVVMPLLAFDQFEEIFTLGRADAGRISASGAFLGQLADLIEGRTPAALKSWLDEHPDQAGEFAFANHHYRVLLSVREDFLPDLESLRESMPMIAVNRFRLQRMDGNAGLQVVAQARHLIDPPVAEEVVRFVAAGPEGAPLGKLEVEPALLSVVCRELNNKRREAHDLKITESLLEGSHDQILTDFYKTSVDDVPLTVRNFIEEQLITTSGYRNSVAVEDAKLKGVSNESIDILVRRRLLRLEERAGVQRIELTHDLLTGVVRSSRDQRHRQEEAEAARLAVLKDEEQKRLELESRQEQEKRERERRSLLLMRMAAIGLAAFTLLAVGGLVFALHSRSEMKKAELKERAAHQEATQALSRIEQSLLIRQAALSGDQTKLNEALRDLATDDTIRFQVSAQDLHYKSNNLETYKFDLFPQKDTLPTGKDAVVFITYLADHPSFQNTLMTGTQKRDFRVSYWGWGCLSRIVALTEYAEPTKPPTVTVFDMCKLLGWSQ